jgi:hypothetical protein
VVGGAAQAAEFVIRNKNTLAITAKRARNYLRSIGYSMADIAAWFRGHPGPDYSDVLGVAPRPTTVPEAPLDPPDVIDQLMAAGYNDQFAHNLANTTPLTRSQLSEYIEHNPPTHGEL